MFDIDNTVSIDQNRIYVFLKMMFSLQTTQQLLQWFHHKGDPKGSHLEAGR